MGEKWVQSKYKGIRYWEHPTRKHGAHKDKYFTLRYQKDGTRKNEGLGWSSEGWTAEKAFLKLCELKQNAVKGEGASRLSEKRAIEKAKRQAEEQERRCKDLEGCTFKSYFLETYYPLSKAVKKESSCKKEMQHFKAWLDPVMRDLPLKDIRPIHLERVRKNILDRGRSLRTVEHVFSTFRLVWNTARRDGFISCDSPTKQVRLKKPDNQRLRYLSIQEADSLLSELHRRDQQVYRMALLSLHTGMRAGEVFSLTWGDVNLQVGFLTLRNTKHRSRVVYLTETVKAMFVGMIPGKGSDLVFKDKKGVRFKEAPTTIRTAINALKLNEGITDRRMRICFHTLRHTHASWLALQGTSLYTIQGVLGHTTPTMTQRYAHLSPNSMKEAIKNLEQTIRQTREDKAVNPHESGAVSS
jgi:integrase